MDHRAWLAIIGGGLVALGAFLPWFTGATLGYLSFNRNSFQLSNQNGLTFAGPMCLLLASVTVVIGIVRLTQAAMPRFLQRSTIVTAIAIYLVLLSQYSGVQHDWLNPITDTMGSLAVGSGFWTCCAGALLALIAGFVMRPRRSGMAPAGTTVHEAIDPEDIGQVTIDTKRLLVSSFLGLLTVAAVVLLGTLVSLPTTTQVSTPTTPAHTATAPPSATVPADSCIVYPSVPSDICVPHGTALPTPTQISTVYVAFLNATASRNQQTGSSEIEELLEYSGSQAGYESIIAPYIAGDNQYIAALRSIPWPTKARYDVSLLTYAVNSQISQMSGATCSAATCNWGSMLQLWNTSQQQSANAVNPVLNDLGLPSSASG
jgi:hypothetical protein